MARFELWKCPNRGCEYLVEPSETCEANARRHSFRCDLASTDERAYRNRHRRWSKGFRDRVRGNVVV